jgi:hypothetical protein
LKAYLHQASEKYDLKSKAMLKIVHERSDATKKIQSGRAAVRFDAALLIPELSRPTK